jgi:hypothetical protein
MHDQCSIRWIAEEVCDMTSVNDSADGSPVTLLLGLELDPAVDPEEAERLGRQLRLAIGELDVDNIVPIATAEVPEGAKGAGLDWGALLVTFGAAGGVFTSVVAVVHDWLMRHVSAEQVSLTIDNDTIVLGRASSEEREKLIDAWVRRHS